MPGPALRDAAGTMHAPAPRAGARCPIVRLFDGEMASWYGSRAIRAMDYLARFAADA